MVGADGENPGFVRAVLLREVGRLAMGRIPILGMLLALGNAAMLLANDRRTFHDQLAGTWVVAPAASAGAMRAEVPANVEAIRALEQDYRERTGAWLPIARESEALEQVSGSEQHAWRGGEAWEALGWAPEGGVRGAYWVEVDGERLRVLGA